VGDTSNLVGRKLGRESNPNGNAKLCVAVQEGLVRSLEQVKRNIESREEIVIDARGAGRFAGEEAEPRAGVRSGHVPNSLNVPFTQASIFPRVQHSRT
jgi:3-mercaptopyruvate sulfurtransferase SseA